MAGKRTCTFCAIGPSDRAVRYYEAIVYTGSEIECFRQWDNDEDTDTLPAKAAEYAREHCAELIMLKGVYPVMRCAICGERLHKVVCLVHFSEEEQGRFGQKLKRQWVRLKRYLDNVAILCGR